MYASRFDLFLVWELCCCVNLLWGGSLANLCCGLLPDVVAFLNLWILVGWWCGFLWLSLCFCQGFDLVLVAVFVRLSCGCYRFGLGF